MKNIIMASFKAKTRQDRLRMSRKKKKIILIHSNRTRNREFQKNSKKIEKNKKHHYGFFSSQNGLGVAEKERKKNYSFHQFLPGQEKNSKKKKQKNKNHHYGFISSQNGTGQAESDTKKKKLLL